MASAGVQGFSRANPFRIPGGPFSPAQREQIERQYIKTTYGDNMQDGLGWKWEWVETRTFPDTGRTYDVVGARIGFPDTAHNELWFDVTDSLTPAEKAPIAARAATTPAVKPAGQVSTSSTGMIPALLLIGTIAAVGVYEYVTRPAPRHLPPMRPFRRRR